VLKSFIHLLSNPFISGVLLAFVSVIAFKFKLHLLSQTIWLFAGLWLFTWIFSPFPAYLLQKSERAQEPDIYSNGIHFIRDKNIMVFASGFTNDTSLHANSQLSETMLQRVVEGVRIYHEIGGEKLILSGPCRDEGGCQGEAAAAVARSLKVPPDNIAIITAGRNTIEELEAYLAEYGKESKFIAVSSARHLNRIKLIADYLGLEVVLSASDYEIKRENGRSNAFQPGFKGIGYTKMFLHEWLGMWYTRWYFWRKGVVK
jgi:uncharacterized SAM-binding protein YcdF (DUF218 family)